MPTHFLIFHCLLLESRRFFGHMPTHQSQRGNTLVGDRFVLHNWIYLIHGYSTDYFCILRIVDPSFCHDEGVKVTLFHPTQKFLPNVRTFNWIFVIALWLIILNWLEDIEKTLRLSNQAAACPLFNHVSFKLHVVHFYAERGSKKALNNSVYSLWFDLIAN